MSNDRSIQGDRTVVGPIMEVALRRAILWLVPALVVSGGFLFLPSPGGSLGWVIVHLTVVVVFGLFLAMSLGDLLDRPWFTNLGPISQQLAAAGSLVMFATGAVALVTLGSSAALRLDPSLQFLQLLSALDIAWAAGATALGLSMLAGRIVGWAGGSVVIGVCVWSVWRYLDIVGFATDGGWLVDAEAMWTYILPYDMGAAVIALTSMVVGARGVGRHQPTAQPRRQS